MARRWIAPRARARSLEDGAPHVLATFLGSPEYISRALARGQRGFGAGNGAPRIRSCGALQGRARGRVRGRSRGRVIGRDIGHASGHAYSEMHIALCLRWRLFGSGVISARFRLRPIGNTALFIAFLAAPSSEAVRLCHPPVVCILKRHACTIIWYTFTRAIWCNHCGAIHVA